MLRLLTLVSLRDSSRALFWSMLPSADASSCRRDSSRTASCTRRSSSDFKSSDLRSSSSGFSCCMVAARSCDVSPALVVVKFISETIVEANGGISRLGLRVARKREKFSL